MEKENLKTFDMKNVGMLPCICAECDKHIAMLVGEPVDMSNLRDKLSSDGIYILCVSCAHVVTTPN